MNKSDLINQIEDSISNLKQCVKDLKKSKLTEVTLYLNTDNGGYSDDSVVSSTFDVSISIDEEEDGIITVGSCYTMYEEDEEDNDEDDDG